MSFLLDPENGRVTGCRWCPSPNFDARPDDAGPVSLIVIHGISLPPGCYGGDGVERLFTNCLDPAAHPYYREIEGLRVSAHFLVRRDGAVVQFVSVHDRAWHAGVSCHEGRERCNDFSVGIEVEGTDDDPFAPDQYDTLVALTRQLVAALAIDDPAQVVGHADIAPGRKTDPGPHFPWARFRTQLFPESAA